MYKILLFNGGVYRFTDMVETVEDMGGLVLRKDCFHIIRGLSFLGEDIQVMLIIPEKDYEIVKDLSKEIKGEIKEFEMDSNEKNMFLTYIPIYNALSRASSWKTTIEIENSIECPCLISLCENTPDKICIIDKLEETLNKLCEQGIAGKRYLKGKPHYGLFNEKKNKV